MINAAASRTPHKAGNAMQLTLLPTSTINARFVLSKSTRERGLRHVAEIRQQLADRATGSGVAVRRLPIPQDLAA